MIDKIKTRPLLGLKVFATAWGYIQITNGLSVRCKRKVHKGDATLEGAQCLT